MAHRILLVDDDADTARVFQHLLRLDGHVVDVVGTMAAARHHIEQHPVDVLITDIQLPDGSGLELLPYARDRGDVRGIVVSGHGDESHRKAAQQAGFEEYLLKPIDLPLVRETIGRLLPGTADGHRSVKRR